MQTALEIASDLLRARDANVLPALPRTYGFQAKEAAVETLDPTP
jgi:hypothetical protein